MTTSLHHRRRPLIALVVMLAASSAVVEASACSMTTPGEKVCAKAYGCCSADSGNAPMAGPELGQSHRGTQALAACETATDRGCGCRSQTPGTPASKPAQSRAESRAEPKIDAKNDDLKDVFASCFRPVRLVSAIQNPPKTPLYLRIEHLLF